MGTTEQAAALRRALTAYKEQHWRPQSQAEKGRGWVRRVQAMTQGRDPRQTHAFWQDWSRHHGRA